MKQLRCVSIFLVQILCNYRQWIPWLQSHPEDGAVRGWRLNGKKWDVGFFQIPKHWKYELQSCKISQNPPTLTVCVCVCSIFSISNLHSFQRLLSIGLLCRSQDSHSYTLPLCVCVFHIHVLVLSAVVNRWSLCAANCASWPGGAEEEPYRPD